MKNYTQYPRFVMIIRHGEKPGDPNTDKKEDGPNLSILGSARATALPSLFTPDPTVTPRHDYKQLTCKLTGAESKFTGKYKLSDIPLGQSRFPQPDFLFATARSHHSNRPFETITPLAHALDLPINQKFDNHSSGIEELKNKVLKKAGKVVLICWHHSTILKLTKAFGVPKCEFPFSKWPGTIFDLIFCITWDSGQANLRVFNEQLLYGDTTATSTPVDV